MGGGLANLVRRIRRAVVKDRLGELDEPVAEQVPGKTIAGGRVVVEPESLQRLGAFQDGGIGGIQDPPVERKPCRTRIEQRIGNYGIHLAEPGNVPKLGNEAAITLDPGWAELDVAARTGQRADGEAQGVGAVFVDEVERIERVALGFRHLLAALVAYQPMDIDLPERHVVHEVQTHHHHPGDPEEDDVEARHQHVAGIVASQLGRFLRPAQRRERPQG